MRKSGWTFKENTKWAAPGQPGEIDFVQDLAILAWESANRLGKVCPFTGATGITGV
jgi:hypothetical protein